MPSANLCVLDVGIKFVGQNCLSREIYQSVQVLSMKHVRVPSE